MRGGVKAIGGGGCCERWCEGYWGGCCERWGESFCGGGGGVVEEGL